MIKLAPPEREVCFPRHLLDDEQATINTLRLYDILRRSCPAEDTTIPLSAEEMATVLDATKMAVYLWLRQLERIGLVAVVRRGRRLGNIYRLVG